MAQFLSKPAPPPTLYKYRGDVARDVKCLLVDRCLYLASPLKLNDPFDCFPPIAVPAAEDYERIIASEVANAPAGYPEAEIRKRCQMILSSEAPRRRFEVEFYEKDLGRLGVLSLSESHDEPLLWAHYASNGTGFSVGYRGRDEGESEALGAAPVSYSMQRPTMNPFNDNEDWFKILHTKSEHWSYEQEWRYVRMAEDGGWGTLTVPRNSIVEVCLGPKMIADDRSAVIEAARALPDQPLIVQVELDFQTYGLIFRDLG